MPIPAGVVEAAQSAQRKWNVPASVSIAQFALESAWGTKMPKNSNNPFGIKARPGEPSADASTREVFGGKNVTIHAPFRKFANFAEAFDAHGELLANRSPYQTARLLWRQTHDVDAYVKEMGRHYATDPNYHASIMAIIRSHNLTQYDVAGVSSPTSTPPPDIEPTPAVKAAMHPAIKVGGAVAAGGAVVAGLGPDWLTWVCLAAFVIAAGVALYFLFNHKEPT